MDQSSITASVNNLFEKHFFSLVKLLSNDLRMPAAFIRYPSYPGMGLVVDGYRVLEFMYFSQPLIGKRTSYARVDTTEEAICFVPYGSKGPMVTIHTKMLVAEANDAGVPEEALLEILVLHEMVHACMMGNIAQHYPNHSWMAPEFRYIHEAVALKVCEFCLHDFFEVASSEHVARYLLHTESVSNVRESGSFYKPYFDKYRAVALCDFWDELWSSQPHPGIFEIVQNLK